MEETTVLYLLAGLVNLIVLGLAGWILNTVNKISIQQEGLRVSVTNIGSRLENGDKRLASIESRINQLEIAQGRRLIREERAESKRG